MKGRAWTEQEENTLKEMYSSHYHVEDIAERLDRSPVAIQSKLCRMKFTPRGYDHHRLMITKKQEEQIYEYYVVQKLSIEKTCERIGVTNSWLHDYLKQKGWNRDLSEANRLKKKRVIPFPELYKAYFEECLRFEDMIKRYKCDYRTIVYSLEKHGLAKIRRSTRLKMREQFKNTGKLFNRTADWSEKL
ncbi:hypothetical protein EauS123_00011 [Exiguobacterium phage vB_EauS-123]|nr:hypothetical protein EauS123_00011 [Exiguobacterium phage vB_EauS-123]